MTGRFSGIAENAGQMTFYKKLQPSVVKEVLLIIGKSHR